MSSTGSVAVRPAPAFRVASWPVLIVFAVGTAIGALASASAFVITQSDAATPAAVRAAPSGELSRLVGNMEAAAQRGDTRLFLEFRNDLAQLVRSATISKYDDVLTNGAAQEGDADLPDVGTDLSGGR